MAAAREAGTGRGGRYRGRSFVAINEVLTRFEAVPLTVQIYREALDRCASKGLRSGAILDALHLTTAEETGAAALLTFNERDFVRLSVTESPPILVPPDPPAVRF